MKKMEEKKNVSPGLSEQVGFSFSDWLEQCILIILNPARCLITIGRIMGSTQWS